MTSEVGSGQVAVFPVFKGFRKAVSTEVDGATADGASRFKRGFSKAGSDAGTTTGRGFKAAFASSSSNPATATLTALTKDVAAASRSLSTSRLKEQDSTGRVRVAEAALTEARSKSEAGSSRVIAAEERLASAQRGLSAAQGITQLSTDGLLSAQSRLAVATVAAAEAARRSTGFSGFFRTVGSGFQGAINAAGSLVTSIGGALVSALSIAGRAFLTTAKIGIGAFTGLIALVGGLTIKGGLTRLLNIEDAQAKLKGLGNSTQTVAEIMNNALDSVKGTFFTLDDAATVAASAVAAGIKPGAELTKYLKLTADAATIAGISLADMGAIINKATTNGKVFTDDLNQLADKGIPIFQWLQKEYGVSGEKLRDMVQAGEVDSATFRKVIEENIGGAALSAGNTTRGAFANMKAAMSRTGAALLTNILPKFQGFFTKVGGFFDTITPKAATFGDKLAGPIDHFLDGALRVLKAIGDISTMDGGFSFSNIRSQFEGAFPGMKGVFDVVAALKPILPTLVDAIKKVTPSLVKLIPQLADLAVKVLPALVGLVPIVAAALGGLANILSTFTFPNFQVAVDGMAGINGDLLVSNFETGVYGPLNEGMFSFVLGLVGKFANGWSQITEGADIFASGLNQALSHGWSQITDTVGGFFSGLGAKFGNGWSQITETVGGFFSGVGARFSNGWSQIVGTASSIVTGIRGKVTEAVAEVAALPGKAIAALGDLGQTFFNAGKAIIDRFAEGIRVATGGVGKAVGKVMDFVKGFFPHSPAKRGPLSGSGWTKLGQSGTAIMDQFSGGFPDANLRLTSSIGASLSVPSSSGPASSRAAVSSGGNVYIDKIVAPDQDPRISGRIMGREFVSAMAGSV